jgi:hypothetical protein
LPVITARFSSNSWASRPLRNACMWRILLLSREQWGWLAKNFDYTHRPVEVPKIPKNCQRKDKNILTGWGFLGRLDRFRLCPKLCLLLAANVPHNLIRRVSSSSRSQQQV